MIPISIDYYPLEGVGGFVKYEFFLLIRFYSLKTSREGYIIYRTVFQ